MPKTILEHLECWCADPSTGIRTYQLRRLVDGYYLVCLCDRYWSASGRGSDPYMAFSSAKANYDTRPKPTIVTHDGHFVVPADS